MQIEQGETADAAPGMNSTAASDPDAAGAAQDAETAGGIEEITVTARKTSEKIQDVPIAVTAFTQKDLSASALIDVRDLQRKAPNLYIRPAQAQGNAIVIQMRGQVQNDTLATLDPSVAVYQDGVYLARPFGSNLSFVDVKDVQVLRGPQGTLFGRNTTGGAVLLATNDPDLDEVGGTVSVNRANDDTQVETGILNIPIVSGRLGIRLVAQRADSDGFARDETNDLNLGTDHHKYVRAKALWKPTDQLSFLATVEIADIDRQNGPADLAFASPTRFLDGDNNGVPDDLNGDGVPDPVDGIARLLVTVASGGTDSIDNYIGRPYVANDDVGRDLQSRLNLQNFSLTTTLEREWATVKLIAGHRDTNNVRNRMDFDNTPYTLLSPQLDADYRQDSIELQFTGNAFERLKWAAGAHWFDEEAMEISHTDAFFGQSVSVFDADVDATSVGAYFQGTYRLTDELSATAGIRYSEDDKSIVSHNQIGTAAGLSCIVPGVAPGEECSRKFDDTFHKVNYTVGLDYHLSDDLLVYGSLTTGYRSGGQNLRGISEKTFEPFGAETVTQYELGFKSDWFERRLRANLAAYWSNYDNIQRSVLVTSGAVTTTVVENAAKATVMGGELEITALPIESLELSAALGITKPKYDKYVDSNGIDRSDEKFDAVPEKTLSLGATHTTHLGNITWTNSITYAWQDDVPSSQANIRTFDPADREEVKDKLTQDAVGLLGARSSVALDSGLAITLWGRNLTDETVYSGNFGFGPPVGMVVRWPHRDREVGVELTYRF